MYIIDGHLPDMSDGKVYEPGELLFWVKLKKKIHKTPDNNRYADPMSAHRLLPGNHAHVSNPKTLTRP